MLKCLVIYLDSFEMKFKTHTKGISVTDSTDHLHHRQTWTQARGVRARTYMPHPRFNHPNHPALRIILTHIRAPQALERLTLHTDNLHPPLREMIVHRRAHDLDVRKRLAEHDDAAAARDEERDEDDVVLRDAVVEQDANRHERGRRGPDLRVQQEHPGVPRAPPFADALREREVQQERLAGLGLGLDEQRADGDVVDDAAEAAFEGPTAVRVYERYVGGLVVRTDLRSEDRYAT